MSEQEQETVAEATTSQVRPDWLPEQFKSPEDMAKSWRDGQADVTRTRQELAELKSQQEQILAAQQEFTAQRQATTTEEQLIEAIESGDARAQLAAMAWLAEQTAKNYVPQAAASGAAQQPPSNSADLLAFAADAQLKAKYDDWDEVKLDIAQLVQQDPDLLPVSGDTPLPQVVSRLERIYKIAKADRLLSQGESVVTAETEANRLAKQQAQTITGASQRPPTTTEEEEYWNSVAEQQLGTVRVGRL